MAEYRSTFRSYGVEFSIVSNDRDILAQASEVASKALLGRLDMVATESAPHVLRLDLVNGSIRFQVDDADHGAGPVPKLWHFFDTCVRILVAEFAVDRVFLHCGVVLWNGKSILFPGDSFTGKTTLVEEFLKRGATYYSDEYAVLDENGHVHPFARPLAIRDRADLSVRYDTSAESLGGKIGTVPIPVNFVFLYSYKKYSRFRITELSGGESVLHTMPFAITLRSAPDFSLNVLNKISERGRFYLGQRGNSNIAVNNIIEIVDKL